MPRQDVTRAIAVSYVKGWQTKTVGAVTVKEHPIVELRLVFGDHEQAREMWNPGGTNPAKEPGQLTLYEGNRRRGELLNAAELASWPTQGRMAEIEIVDTQLLVEEALRVGYPREDSEDNLVIVPHEITAHDMASRVQPLEA
jgi:hypothetical protein